MNINKPSQIFAYFKDFFNEEDSRIQKLKNDNLLSLNDLSKTKQMQENAIRGRKILDKKNIQHFILPENGHLMDDHLINKSFSEIIQKYLIDQRLPFPIISIEFDTNDSDLPKDEVKNLKTLIIAQEHKEPDESSSYISLQCIHELSLNENLIRLAVPETFLIDIDADRIKARHGVCTYYYDDNGNKGILNKDINNAYSSISKVIALLVALSCKNVTFKKSPPPNKKVNQVRQQKGLTAHRSYNFIVIDTTQAPNLNTSNHSSSSTKSMHIRRGHVRHYEDRNVWIEQTVINANKSELINKNYKVK